MAADKEQKKTAKKSGQMAAMRQVLNYIRRYWLMVGLSLVLAAVTVGGGVMGIGGMLLGVPTAAALYRLLQNDVRKHPA